MTADVVLALLVWLGAHGYAWLPEYGLPTIEIGTQADVVEAIEGQLDAPLTDLQRERIETGIAAVYVDAERRIVVGDAYTGTYEVRSTVLHELVHFLQHMQGQHEDAACLQALERDAYVLQEQWLEEQGHPPMFDAFTIMMRAACF